MRKVCHKGKCAHSTVNHFIGQNEFIIDIFFFVLSLNFLQAYL